VKITELTDQLIPFYASARDINHLDDTNLPSKSTIAGLNTDLLQLLFKGFFDNKVTHSSEINMEICAKLNKLSVAIAKNR